MSAFDHSSAVAASKGYDNHRRALDAVDFVDLIKTIHADRSLNMKACASQLCTARHPGRLTS